MKKWLIVFSIIAIVLIYAWIMFSCFYVTPISEGKLESGRFGDFFGTINTFISLLTLLATVYVAFELSVLDRNREHQKDEAEQNRHKIALTFQKKQLLTELRDVEYRRISNMLYELSFVIRKENITGAIIDIQLNFNHFVLTYSHIFPFLNDPITEELTLALEEFCQYVEKGDLSYKSTVVTNLFKKKYAFLKFTQNFMLSELEL